MNPDFTVLHQYQRGVLWSFVLSLAIFVVYISGGANALNIGTEKIIGAIWLAVYTSYCFDLRGKVPPRDNVSTTKFPILHWVLLGILLVYGNVVKPSDFQFLFPIINLGFIIFALFSADAHWDFKKLKKGS